MEKTKKPYLTSIMKFRVRAKNPVPSSIFDEAMKWGTRQSVQKAWNQLKIKGDIMFRSCWRPTKELVSSLESKSWLKRLDTLRNRSWYPLLAPFFLLQVSNWFKNRRSRDRRKEQDEFLQNYYNMDACTSRLVEDTSLYPPNIYHSG